MVRLNLFQTTYLLKFVTNENFFSFVILLVEVIFSKKMFCVVLSVLLDCFFLASLLEFDYHNDKDDLLLNE